MGKSWEAQQRKTCRKKLVFKTVIDAVKKIDFYWKCGKTLLMPYQCDVCGLYHMTSEGLKNGR